MYIRITFTAEINVTLEITYISIQFLKNNKINSVHLSTTNVGKNRQRL